MTQIKSKSGEILYTSDIEGESLKYFVIRLVKEKKSLRGAYLRGADLSRADLSRADLSRADMSGLVVAVGNVTRRIS